jgi:hypothetical protein
MPISCYGPHNAPRDISIQELDWEQLEQASGLHFTSSQRSQLLKTLNAFVEARWWAELSPETPAVRRRLNNQGRYVRTLARWLSDDSPLGTTVLALSFPFERVDHRALEQALWLLDLCTKAGLNRLSDLGANSGRPDKNGPLEPLIKAWHVIYRQAGGRGKGCYKDIDSRTYRGRFLDLLDNALTQAATILTTKDLRELPTRVSQRRQEEAKKRLRKMIHPSGVTLAKRIIAVLT